jgi:hypothetical protein
MTTSRYLNWTPQTLEQSEKNYSETPPDQRAALEDDLKEDRRLHDLGYLGVQREMVGVAARAIDLVEQGNRKRVWDPRPNLDVNTTFPEFQEFKKLARILNAAAYVAFADGNGTLGSQYLLDGLVFSEKMSTDTLVSSLVSVSCRSIILSGFDRHLDRIGVSDWDRVEDFCTGHFKQGSEVSEILKREMSIQDNITFPSTVLEDQLSSNGFNLAAEAAKKLSDSQKADLVRQMKQVNEKVIADAMDRFSGDEGSWVRTPKTPDEVPDKADPTPDELVQMLGTAASSGYAQLGFAYGRTRAQLRLLRLHALIQSYRWKTGHLPGGLRDVADAKDLTDPFSGKGFRYVVLDTNRYNLFSEGQPGMGTVGLVYHKPPPDASQTIHP